VPEAGAAQVREQEGEGMTNAKHSKSTARWGSPSHGNYVVGIGVDPWAFELAFAGRGRFNHGRYAVPSRRAA
jgi:hypothetical protein